MIALVSLRYVFLHEKRTLPSLITQFLIMFKDISVKGLIEFVVIMVANTVVMN
jgi:hypothetical protein